jgi:hypothetical protein
MQTVTLVIGICSGIAILASRPAMALCIYAGTIVWYPQYIAVQLGSLHFNTGRIAVLAILLKIVTDPKLTSGFKWNGLDKAIIASLLLCSLSNAFTTEIGRTLQFNSGQLFDSVLLYFAVRLLIRSRNDYLTFLKGIIWVSVPLALMGVYQAVTWHNPVGFLRQYHSWRTTEYVTDVRYNLCRADITFSHPIMFGLFFAIAGPWCLGLWGYVTKRGKLWVAVSAVVMLLGLLSSMSSGPQLALVGILATLVLYRARRYWKLFLVAIICCILLVEMLSNRRWYYVFASYLCFSAETAYYRCKLIEHALGGGMSGHWLFGFGLLQDPGWWRALDGSELVGTDVTNHYLVILVEYGLLGFIPFMCVVYCACKSLRNTFRSAVAESERWLVWCVLASVAGALLSFFSVALFGQAGNYFYLGLGICGILPSIVNNDVRAQRR